jgi:hypothetical protein
MSGHRADCDLRGSRRPPVEIPNSFQSAGAAAVGTGASAEGWVCGGKKMWKRSQHRADTICTGFEGVERNTFPGASLILIKEFKIN